MHDETAAQAAAEQARASEQLALAHACSALWVATLALMTAFMQTAAPAHRYLIARKIARNLGTLHEEDAVFSTECRAVFHNLSQRWGAKADQLAPVHDPSHSGTGSPRPALAALH